MTNSVPPITINFMLNCYFSPEPEICIDRMADALGTNHWNSPAGLETRKWLQENGLVDLHYRASGKGIAWVDFICDTPLPVLCYQMPQRKQP